ncbi:Zinc finger protein with KRAB and SCAN domains 3 [Apodemus speciosus]|uniref:Zinc finger protein with KRAB and SCAN domains 3 n=1 Tax=Apodemus speciosus TaxID=105296 RepID=A0ABQ0FFD6_APOSI
MELLVIKVWNRKRPPPWQRRPVGWAVLGLTAPASASVLSATQRRLDPGRR